jgi:hypothetical protein
MRFRKALLFMAAFSLFIGASPPLAAQPQPIPSELFDNLHKLIKPESGELRFHEIPWLLSVHDARKKAAAEGKPILVWSGAGGAPIGVC